MSEGIKIRGLRELQAAFRQIDADLPKAIRSHFKDIADMVVGMAQQRMPHITGTAQKSLKPRASQRGAAIAFPGGGPGSGKDKAGYYPWLDFGGGKVGARGITSSSPVAHRKVRGGGFRREKVKGGRYLYPAIAEARPRIALEAEDAVLDVAQQAGFEVR